MEFYKLIPTLTCIACILLCLPIQLIYAQIGLDWNRLRDEITGNGFLNRTGSSDGDQFNFQDSLFGVIEGLQGALGDTGGGGIPGLGGLIPSPDSNGTWSGKPSSFPPGFENLQYVSDSCWNQTMQMYNDFQEEKRYAKIMVYSSGSIVPDPSLEFTGYPADPGLFQQCLTVKENNVDTPFSSHYCSMSTYIGELAYHSGLCVPSACESADLEAFFNTIKNVFDVKEAFLFFTCEVEDVPYYWPDIFVIFLLVVLGTFVLLGSTYHWFVICAQAVKANQKSSEKLDEASEELNKNTENTGEEGGAGDTDAKNIEMEIKGEESVDAPAKNKSKGTLGKVLLCFSIIHNFGKIFDTTKHKGELGALNGIRVLSMIWIITGHTWQFIGTYKVSSPIYLYSEYLPKLWAQTIFSGVYAVDTFFLLSGLLLGYLTMKALKKNNGKINWALFYFHRYYRITPFYMLIIGVWSTLPIHIVSGPGANIFFTGAANQCQSTWWTNLLYINNLWPFPGDLGAQCLGWSWYLANDMQFFIISPLILVLLYKKRKIGFAVIGIFFAISYFSTIGIAYHYGLTIGVNQKPFNNNTIDNPTADHLYGKPYHRIQPYLIGILLGYLLFKLDGKTFNIPKPIVAINWIAALVVTTAITYGLHNTTQGHIIPQGTTIFFYVINATVWGLGVGWIAFACIKGYGGPINTILSWPVWTPLARLTFGAYLVHPMLQFMYAFAQPLPFAPTRSMMTFHAIAFNVVSYAVSLFFSLLIEAPLMGLEKIMFSR